MDWAYLLRRRVQTRVTKDAQIFAFNLLPVCLSIWLKLVPGTQAPPKMEKYRKKTFLAADLYKNLSRGLRRLKHSQPTVNFLDLIVFGLKPIPYDFTWEFGH